MPSTAIAGLDLEALTRAIEGRDAAAQTVFYADDAVLTTIDSQHGPSAPPSSAAATRSAPASRRSARAI